MTPDGVKPRGIRSGGVRNLLTWPLLGAFLRWRWGRLTLQLCLLLLAALVLYDGFTGDALAARNLATVSIWVHFRGFAVLVLLLVGNLFCMACPFTLPRSLAKAKGWGTLRWPRALRNKGVAILSLFILLFSYEYLDLWRSPWLTAWVAVAYFVAAFGLEALFEGSPFCKYVCPLGSFNFVYSALSPTRVQALSPTTCATCVGKECLNGSPTVAGCGTQLFVPQLRSNLDCIQCLDCVRACPHDNVGLLLQRPGLELEQAGWREKGDVGLLAMILTFLAVVNAFGMTPPIYAWLDALGARAGEGTFWPLLLIFGGLGLGLPTVLGLLAALWTRKMTGEESRLWRLLGRFGPAFVPLGFAVWFVHYQFHFLTGALTLVPVMHFFLKDHGWMDGTPDFSLAELVRPGALHTFEVFGVTLGFLWSFAVLWRVGLKQYGSRSVALRAIAPWCVMLVLLTLAAVRIFGYPMEMRGLSGG